MILRSLSVSCSCWNVSVAISKATMPFSMSGSESRSIQSSVRRKFFEFFDISGLFVIACALHGERVSVQIAFWARTAVSSVRLVRADSAHGRQRGDTSGSMIQWHSRQWRLASDWTLSGGTACTNCLPGMSHDFEILAAWFPQWRCWDVLNAQIWPHFTVR